MTFFFFLLLHLFLFFFLLHLLPASMFWHDVCRLPQRVKVVFASQPPLWIIYRKLVSHPVCCWTVSVVPSMVNYTLQWFAQDPDVCTSECAKADTNSEARCSWRRSNRLCGPFEFGIKMWQITTEVLMLRRYTSTFTYRVNALILTGRYDLLCLWLREWRIAGLIASPLHNNWGPENLLLKQPCFLFLLI